MHRAYHFIEYFNFRKAYVTGQELRSRVFLNISTGSFWPSYPFKGFMRNFRFSYFHPSPKYLTMWEILSVFSLLQYKWYKCYKWFFTFWNDLELGFFCEYLLFFNEKREDVLKEPAYCSPFKTPMKNTSPCHWEKQYKLLYEMVIYTRKNNVELIVSGSRKSLPRGYLSRR